MPGSPHLTKDKNEPSPRSNCLVWMMIRLKNRNLSLTGFISSSSYPIRLKFKLSEDSVLDVLKVATRRASLGGWIDTCLNLRRVRK